MIDSIDLDEGVSQRKLRKYMENYLSMMMCICSVFLRMINTDEAEQKRRDIWDYLKQSRPDIYPAIRRNVLNLGTNDSFAMLFQDGYEQAREKFTRDYAAFLRELRRLNGPETHIICALGSMNYYLYPEIEQAVREHVRSTGDQRMHTFRYRPMSPMDGFGAAGHPSLATQRKMAQELKDFIQSL